MTSPRKKRRRLQRAPPVQRKSHSHLAAGALCDRRYLGEEGKDDVKVEVDEVNEEEDGEEKEEEEEEEVKVEAAAVLRSGGLPSRAKKCARTRCLSTP